MATIGLALSPLFTSHFLINNLIDLNWTWVVRMEYLMLFLVIIGWSWFVKNLYPSNFPEVVAWVITAVFSWFPRFTLFLPVSIFSYATLAYYPLMILLISIFFTKVLRGALKKNGLDLMYFLAFILFFVGGVHDLTGSSGKVKQ